MKSGKEEKKEINLSPLLPAFIDLGTKAAGGDLPLVGSSWVLSEITFGREDRVTSHPSPSPGQVLPICCLSGVYIP